MEADSLRAFFPQQRVLPAVLYRPHTLRIFSAVIVRPYFVLLVFGDLLEPLKFGFGVFQPKGKTE
jgi:hypothetical protein